MSRSILRTLYDGTNTIRSVVNDAGRAKDIAAILAKYGFSALIDQKPRTAQKKKIEISGKMHVADGPNKRPRLVMLLEELGPTFVKFGQILSTRPELIGIDFAEKLKSLQDHVKTIPYSVIEDSIQKYLGESTEILFETFEQVPLASGSIAQVHRAQLKGSHRQVVIKVQRPHLRKTIIADLSLMEFLAERILALYPEAQGFDLKGMIAEFRHSIINELNFTQEKESLLQFRENFKEHPKVHIPEIFPEFCHHKILTMEYIRGKKLTTIRNNSERKKMAEIYLDTAYKMLFKDGFFHGDLHPGNVLLEEDGRLGILDFGMVGRLSGRLREKLTDMLFSVIQGDLENVARLCYSVARGKKNVDYANFENDAIDVIEAHAMGKKIEDIQMASLLSALIRVTAEHELKLPQNLSMVFKAMLTTEGLAKELAADIDPIEAAKPYIEELIKQRYSLDRIKEHALLDLLQVVDLSRQIPGKIDRLIHKFESGDVTVQLQHNKLDRISHGLVRAINRAAVALVVSAAIIAGANTIHNQTTPSIFNISIISWSFLSIAFLGTIWLAVGILKGK